MCDHGKRDRSFLLHIRCYECQKLAAQELLIPDDVEAPTSIDELMESNILQTLHFCCKRCDSVIGAIVAVNMREWQERAA